MDGRRSKRLGLAMRPAVPAPVELDRFPAQIVASYPGWSDEALPDMQFSSKLPKDELLILRG